VNGRSKMPTHLRFESQPWGEILVEKTFHCHRQDLEIMVYYGGEEEVGGGRGRAIFSPGIRITRE
jgi:hypothetical protein